MPPRLVLVRVVCESKTLERSERRRQSEALRVRVGNRVPRAGRRVDTGIHQPLALPRKAAAVKPACVGKDDGAGGAGAHFHVIGRNVYVDTRRHLGGARRRLLRKERAPLAAALRIHNIRKRSRALINVVKIMIQLRHEWCNDSDPEKYGPVQAPTADNGVCERARKYRQ